MTAFYHLSRLSLILFLLPLASSFAPPSLTSSPFTPASATSALSAASDPLLVRAARGESVERPPVWMMRQAGRHIKEYRDLVAKYPTFRERSEIPEVAVEISLQPHRNYNTDGCILFSDILTPLPGMGLTFDIEEKKGPVLRKVDSWEQVCDDRSRCPPAPPAVSDPPPPPPLARLQVRAMHKMEPDKTAPFTGEALRTLRKEVAPGATVLGFVGCPYTLATYLVEGGSSAAYLEIKKMMNADPTLLHAMLKNLADSIAEYACYQIESGAQVIQVFDSWAGYLAPKDYVSAPLSSPAPSRAA
jgi:uroporphyrinogen decarboxylase